ncbi:unnamed protein product [Candidula unifasciata]|uniref:DUF1731 domain-containing protein n=1 Tax=Candidula unifasciata TaxID=100452 RepID=A0A8S4A2B3_9EUPU|nr:unnamed protein product [Candidula unifasciata]
MSIVVGGGTGFVGKHFAKLGISKGFKIINVSRTAKPNCITWNDLSRSGLPDDCAAVVSLSGEPILQPFKWWTPEMKLKIRESRIDKVKLLNQAICAAPKPPGVFVSISGVGYYKPDAHKEYTESDIVEPFDFLSEVTRDWEAAAVLPSNVKTRLVVVRSGVVLGNDGGMVANIKTPFYFGLGGPIGSGKQWLPWIYVEDTVGIIMHAIENEHITGILNGTAPNPVTSEEFTKAYASALRRPHLFPMPAFVAKAVFGAEAAGVLLEGQKVLPKRTLEMGYTFKYTDIKWVCEKLVSS